MTDNLTTALRAVVHAWTAEVKATWRIPGAHEDLITRLVAVVEGRERPRDTATGMMILGDEIAALRQALVEARTLAWETGERLAVEQGLLEMVNDERRTVQRELDATREGHELCQAMGVDARRECDALRTRLARVESERDHYAKHSLREMEHLSDMANTLRAAEQTRDAAQVQAGSLVIRLARVEGALRRALFRHSDAPDVCGYCEYVRRDTREYHRPGCPGEALAEDAGVGQGTL